MNERTFTKDELLNLAKEWVAQEMSDHDKDDRMLMLGRMVHFITDLFPEEPRDVVGRVE